MATYRPKEELYSSMDLDLIKKEEEIYEMSCYIHDKK